MSDLNPNLGPQFTVHYEGQSPLNTHTPESAGWHSVVARNEDKDPIGVLHWRRRARGGIPGQIDWVEVDPSFKRLGIATAMLRHAQSLDLRPSPKHSPERTDEGQAWAKSVGGRLPRRRA